MQTLLYTFLIFGSFLRKLNGCVAQYGQCDGIGYTGEKTCCAPFTCQYSNAWYSQCLSASTVTTTPVSTNTTCHTLYSQCNGQNWAHTTCCQASVCTYVNEYYSQCLPGTTSLTSTSARTTSTASTSRVTTPTATTTASPMRTSTFTPSRTTTATTRSTTSTSTVRTTTKTTRSATSTSTTRTTTSTSMTRLSTTTARLVTSSTTPKTVTTTRTSTSMSSFKTTGSGTCSSLYSQCGGIGWTGSQLCCSGSTCRYINDYYSQCLPTDSSSTTMGSARTTTITTSSNNNDGRQPGVTTRYWDCCKASCGWPGKASVTSPVRTCAQNGNTTVDPNTQSICAGGSAYMCNNQQPWSVNSSLAYGFVAANIQGQSESNWCCACYSLIFTSGPVVGKELIVQVTNTGGDLGTNHFDLQMPGGGVGIFDGCSVQFPGPYSWGQRYGGVSQRSDCDQLPSILRSGCYWRFDWFMNADNPTMRFRQVTCPSVLTTKTGCSRL